jgi:8-oxo-dGTP pyrophosphatase MutT (NUDIX family)
MSPMNATQLSRAISERANHEESDTGSVVAAFNQDGHVLIQRRHDSGKWTLPGGHAMAGEKPEQTASREFKEETGLETGALSHLGTAKTAAGHEVHVFRAIVSGQPSTGHDPDNEAQKFQWLDPKSDTSMIPWHHEPDVALGFLGIPQSR